MNPSAWKHVQCINKKETGVHVNTICRLSSLALLRCLTLAERVFMTVTLSAVYFSDSAFAAELSAASFLLSPSTKCLYCLADHGAPGITRCDMFGSQESFFQCVFPLSCYLKSTRVFRLGNGHNNFTPFYGDRYQTSGLCLFVGTADIIVVP